MSRDFFGKGELKGELLSLRNKLDSNDSDERKKAAKRVVALMRAGDNVAQLFASMLRCVKTSDLELKKLVYNYIVTYSQEQSEQSIMVVNTLVQDSEDYNPLVRALAIRTMSRIHIETVAEALVIPLKKSMKDDHPFVRKTAVLAVAKLYDSIPETVENSGLLQELLHMISDDNPLVVSNTAAALMEINEKRSEPIFKLNGGQEYAMTLVRAIQASTDWCRIILFDVLSNYEPESEEIAAEMIDRMIMFLKSPNPSVVIGAFKCIFSYMDFDSRRPQDMFPQIIPPLITLVNSAEPEIQYVMLRTLSLFVRKYPKVLAKEIRVFFCKYNDPSYVKMEKLDIIIMNASPTNIALVLDEIGEYCNAVDVGFVRKTVKAIGQLALKIPSSARRCVDILVKLVEGKAEYAVEEAIVVVSDLLRKFPGEFESVIGKVCTNIDKLKEPAAKSALIWILGEYNALIENVDVLLDPFLDTFHDEDPEVQIQLITSIVKVYLEDAENTRDQLQFMLSEATKESVLPDVRNRAMIYWRLLSLDAAGAKQIISFAKDSVESSQTEFTDDVLTELIRNMGTAAGVLHIVPSKFVVQKYITEETETPSDRVWHDLPIRNSPSPVVISADWDMEKFYLQITNVSARSLSNLAVAVNSNAAGFALHTSSPFPESLDPDDLCTIEIPYSMTTENCKSGSAVSLDFALRTSIGIVYFTDFIDFRKLTRRKFTLLRADFLQKWTDSQSELKFTLEGTIANAALFQQRGVFVVAERENEFCVAFELPGARVYLADLEYNEKQVNVTLKGDKSLFMFIQESAKYAFCVE